MEEHVVGVIMCSAYNEYYREGHHPQAATTSTESVSTCLNSIWPWNESLLSPHGNHPMIGLLDYFICHSTSSKKNLVIISISHFFVLIWNQSCFILNFGFSTLIPIINWLKYVWNMKWKWSLPHHNFHEMSTQI